MTISANYPSIRPSLLLDFANGKALDPRITFSRPTTARYYDANTSAIAEQNLFLQSQALATTWTTGAATAVNNSILAPDGTTTGTLITGSSSTGGVFQSALPAAGTYTISCYAQAGTATSFSIYLNFGALGGYAQFNLSTGSPTGIFALGSGFGAITGTGTATMTQVGTTSWYRCVWSNIVVTSTYIPALVTGTGTQYLWGAQLEIRNAVSAYQITTTATVTNYIPVLLSAASNVPRFDHNPTTRESLGLLIEEQRTNLITYSEQFDNAAWATAAFGSTGAIIPNLAISPDGTQNADLFYDLNTTTNTRVTQQDISLTTGTTYTMSAYVKPYGNNFAIFRIGQAFTVNNVILFYNISAGTIGTITRFANANSPTVVGTPTITLVGNSFYRITVTFTANVTATHYCQIAMSTADNTFSYTGNGYSGIFVWGAQLEAGAFPTSYIPTVASQVIRSADSASMTGTNFSSWFNQAQGSFYSSSTRLSINGGNNPIYQVQNTDLKTIDLIMGNTNINFRYNSNLIIGLGITNGKISVSYNASTYVANASVNGSATSSSTATSASTSCNALQIGFSSALNNYFNGTISKIAYYPVAVTNTNLTALTGS
jgi:hypothetical protein